jgi:hypothetical protein
VRSDRVPTIHDLIARAGDRPGGFLLLFNVRATGAGPARDNRVCSNSVEECQWTRRSPKSGSAHGLPCAGNLK